MIIGEVRLYDIWHCQYHFNQDFGRAIYINNQFASNGSSTMLVEVTPLAFLVKTLLNIPSLETAENLIV